MAEFIRGDMQHHVQDGFSIIIPADYAFRVFGDKLNLSRITAAPQAHQQPHLIIDLSANPNDGALSFNNNTNS